MIKIIKQLFIGKTQLKQKEDICNYLDQLQNKTIEGMKLV